VIFAPALKYLEREMRASGVSLPLAYYHERWTRHGAPLLDHLGAVLDHVESFSSGGADTDRNLVTACNKCNARKNNSTVDVHQERYPYQPIKGRFGEPTYWDGLSTLFVLLAERYRSELTVTEVEWLEALTESSENAGVA
jgi:HNH endonuclease